MLSSKHIPDPLIRPEERDPIVIDELDANFRFREVFAFQQVVLLLSRLAWMKLTRQRSPVKAGVILRNFCQRMGVLWIKLGQLLALRVDAFPPEVCAELSKLQDQAHGFPAAQSKHLLEEELGMPVEEVFAPFIERPFAAASISQVHKAFLAREQVWVAVKVRKPNVQRMFAHDMRMIRRLIGLLEWLGVKPFMRWQDLGWEIEQVMIEELDYRYEAANMRRMKKSLRRHPMYVPKVFRRYSTPAVLTMEFVHGVLMTDYLNIARTDPEQLQAWCRANKIDPERVGKRLLFSNLRQLFEDNLFHGDLHPGNILLLRNSRVAFIDFGSISFSDRDFLKKYAIYMQALTNQQFAKVFDIHLMFSDSIPSENLTRLKHHFIELLRAWHDRSRIAGLPYDEKSVRALNDGFAKLFGHYRMGMPWSFLRFVRASGTMDAALRELIPHHDVNRLVMHYFEQRQQRLMRRTSKSRNNALSKLPGILEIPVQLNETMFFRSSIIRRMAQVFEGMMSKVLLGVSFACRLMTFGLRVSLLLMGLAWAELYGVAWVRPFIPEFLADLFQRIPHLDMQVWFLAGLTLLYLERLTVSLHRIFRQSGQTR